MWPNTVLCQLEFWLLPFSIRSTRQNCLNSHRTIRTRRRWELKAPPWQRMRKPLREHHEMALGPVAGGIGVLPDGFEVAAPVDTSASNADAETQ